MHGFTQPQACGAFDVGVLGGIGQHDQDLLVHVRMPINPRGRLPGKGKTLSA
jgi:hypothetical protein